MDENEDKVRRGEMSLEDYVHEDMLQRAVAVAREERKDLEQEFLYGKPGTMLPPGLLASLRRGGVTGTVQQVSFESNPGSYVPPELSYKIWDAKGELVDPPAHADFGNLEMRVLGMDLSSEPDYTAEAYKDAKTIRFGAMYGLNVVNPHPGSISKLMYFEQPSKAQMARATAWWLRRMMLDAMLWKMQRDKRLRREAKRKARQEKLAWRREVRRVGKLLNAKQWRKDKRCFRKQGIQAVIMVQPETEFFSPAGPCPAPVNIRRG